jgi:hypothetical protein
MINLTWKIEESFCNFLMAAMQRSGLTFRPAIEGGVIYVCSAHPRLYI